MSVWTLLPVVGAPLVHGPVMVTDAFGSLKLPLDGGATLRGRRLFGDNKTLRGALFMCGGTVAAAQVLHRLPWYRERLPAELRDAGPLAHGGALGFAVVAGELPNSFLKRQLGIAPGKRRGGASGMVLMLIDQADFVPVAALAMAPWWRMRARDLALAFGLVAAIHLGVNVVGYAIGARDEWI